MTNDQESKLNCGQCASLHQRFEIKSPADLSKVIRVARDNIADGTILEVPSRSSFLSEPFSKITSEGPWDDVISYGFSCTSCGQLFYLSAETYHGSGGEWRPVSRM